MTQRRCKDCIAEGVTTNRSAPHPGPRCVTHHRAKRKADRLRAHARRTEATYGISGEEYWELYEAQGGRCVICQKATGATKRLAVDHDHSMCDDHPPEKGCPKCIRGILCGPCNQLIGRYDNAALRRAIDYVDNPPAQRRRSR